MQGAGASFCTVAQKGQSQISLPKHKTISQNTKQFPKTQINFPKHKFVSQNTNRFLKTQINLSKHEPVCQNTNQFLETQTNFAKHKSMDWALALQLSERAWKGLIPRIFRVQHGDIFMRVTTHQAFSDKMFCSHCGSEVKSCFRFCVKCGNPKSQNSDDQCKRKLTSWHLYICRFLFGLSIFL